jgi:hypothetical protein
MRDELRKWGIILMLSGAASFLVKSNFYHYWGGVLILLGLLNFFIINKWIYLIDSVIILYAGLLNILIGQVFGKLIGATQIIMVAYLIFKFSWYGLSDEQKADLLDKVSKNNKKR